jgi:peptide chain release factor 3
MARAKDGYFVNDTGKSIQELVDAQKRNRRDVGIGSAITSKHIAFLYEYEGFLTDEQLAELNPDEKVLCKGYAHGELPLSKEIRTLKEIRPEYASTVFGAERTTIDEAFPGDVVGLVNATGLNIGDSLYDEAGPSVQFPPIPQFSPEVFATARPLDTGKFKQFRKGLDQLNEEGVVQVLKDPDWGDASPVLAAVGQLQFDVFANRLDIEFNAPIEILSAPYQAIRLTDSESAEALREKQGVRILARLDGRLVALFENKYALARVEQNEPELTLEHIIAG